MADSLNANQIFLKKLTEIVMANLGNENFGVQDLARELGLSRYLLTRRLYSISGTTINKFIREIRLKEALEMLKNEQYTVAEVSYRTGFGSPAYFIRSFHKYYGHTPGEVKKREILTLEPGIELKNHADKNFEKSGRRNYIFSFQGILIFILLASTLGILIYVRSNNALSTDDLVSSDGRVSIAVLPFRNMTNDTTWNNWQENIQQSLISSFSNSRELKVRQQETLNPILKATHMVEYATITPDIAGKISKKLEAGLFIYGNFEKAGSSIRLNAQLIKTRTREVLRSFSIKGPDEQSTFFSMIDLLTSSITDFLIISRLIKDYPIYQHDQPSTNYAESLRYCYYGDQALAKKDFSSAIDWFLKAVEIDTNNYWAETMLYFAYDNNGMIEQSLNWAIKCYKKKDKMSIIDQLWSEYIYASSFDSPEVQIKYLNQLLQIDDQMHGVHFLLGCAYLEINQYEKSVNEFKKMFAIYKRWKSKAFWIYNYTYLGLAYHKERNFRAEKTLYRKAERDFPDDPELIYRQSILALVQGKAKIAERYIEKFKSLLFRNSLSEGDVTVRLASIYSEAGILDQAEACYRKALSLQPKNPRMMKQLALFLINKNRNLDEVQELMDNAMNLAENRIEFFEYSDLKGWGLFKQGKYQKALETLQKTWDEAPFKLYSLRSHLEEVKKVIAEQNLKF